MGRLHKSSLGLSFDTTRENVPLSVRLRKDVRASIVAHAQEEAPNECCGLLIGEGLLIDESVRAGNLSPSPTKYVLDPAAHVATIRRLRGTTRTVVGAYHSHPHTPAVPSETDRAEAFYSDFVWMIVSLARPEAEVAAFKLTDEGVFSIAIILEP